MEAWAGHAVFVGCISTVRYDNTRPSHNAPGGPCSSPPLPAPPRPAESGLLGTPSSGHALQGPGGRCRLRLESHGAGSLRGACAREGASFPVMGPDSRDPAASGRGPQTGPLFLICYSPCRVSPRTFPGPPSPGSDLRICAQAGFPLSFWCSLHWIPLWPPGQAGFHLDSGCPCGHVQVPTGPVLRLWLRVGRGRRQLLHGLSVPLGPPDLLPAGPSASVQGMLMSPTGMVASAISPGSSMFVFFWVTSLTSRRPLSFPDGDPEAGSSAATLGSHGRVGGPGSLCPAGRFPSRWACGPRSPELWLPPERPLVLPPLSDGERRHRAAQRLAQGTQRSSQVAMPGPWDTQTRLLALPEVPLGAAHSLALPHTHLPLKDTETP